MVGAPKNTVPVPEIPQQPPTNDLVGNLLNSLKTPEGMRLIANLIGAASGDPYVGAGIAGASQQQFEFAKQQQALADQEQALADKEQASLEKLVQTRKNAMDDFETKERFKLALKEETTEAKVFKNRTQSADKILKDFENKKNPYYKKKLYRIHRKLPGELMPDELLLIKQAESNFLNAVLRRESGAVISPAEFETGDKQYFPQPGDSAEVVKQKQENRAMQYQDLQKDKTPKITGGYELVGVK